MSKLLSYLKPYLLRMSAGFAIKFIATILDLVIPWILAHLIDDIVPLKDMGLIVFWGVMMVICSIAALFSNIIANTMASKVAALVTRKIRYDLFSKILYLSCRRIDDFTIPSLISRLTSDTYITHQMIGMMQRVGIRAPILLLGGIIVTMVIDFNLSLVLVSILPFIIIVVYFISKKGIPLFRKLQGSVDKLVNVVRENLTGIRIIKALSKTGYEKERFAGVNAEVVDKETKAGFTMALSNPVMNLLLNTGLVLVIWVGAIRVDRGVAQPGMIIAFMTYFTIILNSMLIITRIFVIYSKGQASFTRIAEVLDTEEEMVIEPQTDPKAEDGRYHISFENVSFSYNQNEKNLENISFSILQGETLGIIGATGSGKSTVIKLLMRFYDPDEGVIRISGRNIRSFSKSELYTKFGIVFQNDVLFADTINENIDFGRNLSHERIEHSADMSQAGEFISSFDNGHDHELTVRGTNISGGQKQRVLISRALAGDPEILILDDSSSALDYKTEYLLRKALHKEMEDTTTIIVAQRVSSIMHADKIMVLEDGVIAGYGTHDALMKDCPSYRDIFTVQTGVKI